VTVVLLGAGVIALIALAAWVLQATGLVRYLSTDINQAWKG